MINPNPFSTLWVSFLGRDKPTKSSIVLLTVSIQTALCKTLALKGTSANIKNMSRKQL